MHSITARASTRACLRLCRLWHALLALTRNTTNDSAGFWTQRQGLFWKKKLRSDDDNDSVEEGSRTLIDIYNIVALGYFSKFGILSKRPTSETVFVKYLLQLAFSGALVWIIGKTASKRTRFEGNTWGEKTRESRRSQVSREITESQSSSCEVIILRNKIHGENIRVCMDYLRLS